MPSVKLSPIANDQIVTHAGAPASGWYWSAFAAGSSSPQPTYTSSAGTVAQAAQITLNADGVPDNPIWLVAGLAYKFVLYDDSGVSQRTVDNVVGINDTSVSIAQWVASGLTPTYISANQFSLVGDQTTEFHVGRRVQATVTAGTVYGTITASAYTTLTTVTVALDSGALDAGLSAVNLSILRADHPAIPTPTTQDIQLAAGKSIVFEGTTDDAFEATLSGGDPTADRTLSLPDKSGTLATSDDGGVAGLIRNLQASATGTSATVTLSADAVVLENASSQLKTFRSVSLSIAGTATGANGLDTGTLAGSTWYYVWGIGKADGTVAGLLSTSATAPTLPSGYTYKALLGSIRTDGTGNKYPLSFIQYGRFIHYKVASTSNVTSFPMIANGVQGSVTTPTWVAVSLATFVPPIASRVKVLGRVTNGSVIAAPNNIFGGYSSGTNPPPIALNTTNSAALSDVFAIESGNIYYAGDVSASQLYCTGFELNL
jgi:hypothetical protein